MSDLDCSGGGPGYMPPPNPCLTLRLHTPEANRPRIESIDFKRLGIEKIDFRGPGGDTIDSSGLATKELGFSEAWG